MKRESVFILRDELESLHNEGKNDPLLAAYVALLESRIRIITEHEKLIK